TSVTALTRVMALTSVTARSSVMALTMRLLAVAACGIDHLVTSYAPPGRAVQGWHSLVGLIVRPVLYPALYNSNRDVRHSRPGAGGCRADPPYGHLLCRAHPARAARPVDPIRPQAGPGTVDRELLARSPYHLLRRARPSRARGLPVGPSRAGRA